MRRSAPRPGKSVVCAPSMATIKIPPVLRASVGGEKQVQASGANVGDVLRDLAASHPPPEEQPSCTEGELNPYVNVYLNDEDVRVLDGLDTAVGDTDTLVILPAMAGGEGPALAADALAPSWVSQGARSPPGPRPVVAPEEVVH